MADAAVMRLDDDLVVPVPTEHAPGGDPNDGSSGGAVLPEADLRLAFTATDSIDGRGMQLVRGIVGLGRRRRD